MLTYELAMDINTLCSFHAYKHYLNCHFGILPVHSAAKGIK
jgi:hypothetical protein